MSAFTIRKLGVAAALGVTAAVALANGNPNPSAGKARKAPVIIAPPAGEVLAEALKAEQDAYVRRLDVCTRLRQIAGETGDDALAATADELEKQAGALYQQRVAKLGVSPNVPPRATDTILDARLGAGVAVDPLKVAAPQPLDKTATAGRGAR